MTPNLNLWLIPVLPLAGAAVNGFFGRRKYMLLEEVDNSHKRRI